MRRNVGMGAEIEAIVDDGGRFVKKSCEEFCSFTASS